MFKEFAEFGALLIGNSQTSKYAAQAWNLTDEELRDAQRVEDLNAVDSLIRGSVLAGRMRSKASQVIAKQRLSYAANGVDSSVGTPLEVAGGTAMMAEIDARSLLNDAVREAWGHQRMSTKLGRQRRIAEAEYQAGQAGRQAQTGSAAARYGASVLDAAVGQMGGGGLGSLLGGK